MAAARLNDPLQLTVFDPFPPEFDHPKEESLLGKVLRRVTGSTNRLASRISPNSSRRGSFSDAAQLPEPRSGEPQVEFHRVSDAERGEEELISGSLFSPGGPRLPATSNGTRLLGSVSEASEDGGSTRTLGNVLKRIKEIVAKGNEKDPQPFRDSDFKHYWIPDSLSRDCYECGERFTTFRRRRHCRVCGQIFCSRCADQEVPGHLLGYLGSLRMCSFCSQVVLSRARYLEPSGSAVKAAHPADGRLGRAAGAPIQAMSPSPSKNALSDQNRYQLFGGQPEEAAIRSDHDLPSQKGIDDSRGLTYPQLREVWLEMNHTTDGLELKIHRHRFRAYPDCVSGAEIVDWLIKRGKTTTRRQASRIGQGLLNFKFLECLTAADMVFADEHILFKPKTVTNELEDVSVLTGSSHLVENEEPVWLREIEQPDERLPASTMEMLDSVDDTSVPLDFYGPRKHIRRTDSNVSLSSQMPDIFSTTSVESNSLSQPIIPPSTPPSHITEDAAFRRPPELEIWRNPDHPVHSPTSSDAEKTLDKIFHEQLHALLRQLENWEGLDDEWHDLILTLARKVTDNVAPSVREHHDDMDIRQFVHVKTIPGGKSSESTVVSGVVCSKHVAHRKMRQSFVNPKILLYGTALEFQPAEDKFNSLEPVMQEEAEFLKNCVASISEFQPDILLVERNVSRLAQDFLFAEGVTLVANVKPSIMDRISRCTGAERFSLLEGQVYQPQLGTCGKFDVRTVDLKPYMAFDGCPKNLGCTVLLRGGTKQILRKVKKIFTFIVYCQYNWKLEKSFLVEEHAVVPNSLPERTWHFDPVVDITGGIGGFVSSVSPLIRPNLPFLLTETGKHSAKRFRLPDVLYWSRRFTTYTGEPAASVSAAVAENKLLPVHPLLGMHITAPITSPVIQSALANFRACGGRLEQPKLRPDASTSPVLLTQTPVKGKAIADCFDVYRHQRLAILCSIHACEAADVIASFCVFPWILVIDFYGKNDLTLGDYLETFCFRLDAHCPNQSCSRGVKEHVRRFASGDAAISVTIRDLEDLSAPPLTKIVTWTWCRICRKVSPIVAISDSTWSMSFAKYIDLRLHASEYLRDGAVDCGHSIHRDHVQYFAFGQTVAAFKLTLVKLREIDSPHIVITVDDFRNLRDRQELIEMTKLVAIKGHNVFATIADYLTTCQSLELEKLDEKLAALTAIKRAEKQFFKDWLECLQLKLASPLLKFDATTAAESENLRDFIWDIEDSVNSLKRKITETATTWSTTLSEVEVVKRKEERKHAHNMKSFQSTPEFFPHEDMPPMPCVISVLTDPSQDSDSPLEQTCFVLGTEELDMAGDESYTSIDFAGSPKSDTGQLLRHSVTSVNLGPQGSTDGSAPRDMVDAAFGRSISRHKSGQSSGASNIVPYPFPPNEHYVLGESDRVPVVVYDDELSSMIAAALSSTDYATQLEGITKPFRKEPRSSRNVSGEGMLQPQSSDYLTPSSSVPLSAEPISPVLSFIRDAAEGSAPFLSVEHSSMCGPSNDYQEAENREPLSKPAEPTTRPKSANKSTAEPKPFIEVQFGDQVAKFYCRIYFPEEFRLFRAMVFPYGEDRFIRSLTRCVAWKATGGKSGSTFSKTADGRFVLKQMSRLEVQSFMEFAPHYFNFMAQAAKDKRPTVFTKVVGVYRIGFKNSLTGAQVKQDLLVMENLFYGRKIQQVYDLKGSLRNRLASTDAKADAELVLLDENFLKRICDNPLYIRPHAKLFLRKALQDDTLFLSNLYVMDYSLLVGIDEDSKEIVVGIIDYIRTFTWDKRLEMVVKSTNLLGGQKGLPTIVSPELYRTRFCEAMERYFLPVPDEWYGLARYADGI